MPDPAPMLPGLEPPTPASSEPGYVEQETRKQIDVLTRLGYIQDHHAGQVALAIFTARSLDRLEGRGAASGQANLSRALKEIFEMLPQPDAATQDALSDALAAILAEDAAKNASPAE